MNALAVVCLFWVVGQAPPLTDQKIEEIILPKGAKIPDKFRDGKHGRWFEAALEDGRTSILLSFPFDARTGAKMPLSREEVAFREYVHGLASGGVRPPDRTLVERIITLEEGVRGLEKKLREAEKRLDELERRKKT